MYKCGTSWLLHILASHPDVVGWREFDPILAAFRRPRGLRDLPGLIKDYSRPDPADPVWMQRQETLRPKEGGSVFRDCFLGRGWIPLGGAARQREAAALSKAPTEHILDRLLALDGTRVRRSHGPLINPRAHTKTLGYLNCRRQDLLDLMDSVRSASDVAGVAPLFYRFLIEQTEPGSTVAFKAADQVPNLSKLHSLMPHTRTLAIVRDGRDAAVSARHYEKLMREQEAPWQVHRTASWRRLLGWSMRALKLAEHARRGEITVIRYEDLHTDFPGVCRALFEQLELPNDDTTLAAVREATDIRRLQTAEANGESLPHNVRRGVVGEWKSVLSPAQARRSWAIAGDALRAFGYSEEGNLGPSPLALKSSV